MRKEEIKLKTVAQKIKDSAALISAIIVIGSALFGVAKWIISEVSASTNSRIAALEDKMDKTTQENKMAIARLELLNLIQTDPDNVVEIERVGKDYFSAGGDYYMSSVFSRWAQEHGADATFVIGH